MKRAFICAIAVLAVLLVYPAAMPSAKSLSTDDTPTIHIITPQIPIGDQPPGSGDGDDGDADDLSGIRGGERPTGAVSSFDLQVRLVAKVWWMYLFYLR